jgi:hypothetical protein
MRPANLQRNLCKLICVVLVYGVICLYFTYFVSDAYEDQAPSVMPRGTVIGMDFWDVMVASRAVMAGHPIYRDNREFGPGFTDPSAAEGECRYAYPPVAAYLFVPLAVLPDRASLKLWSVIQIVLILLPVVVLLRGEGCGWPITAAAALVVLSSYPVLFALERGNFDSLAMFFCLLGLWLWTRNRNGYLVGLCLAVAATLKLYPLAVIGYFVLKREWRVVGAAVVISVLLLLLTSGQGGSDNLGNYFRVVQDLNNSSTDLFIGNHSMRVFLTRATTYIMPLTPERMLAVFTFSRVVNFLILAIISAYVLMTKTKDRRLCREEVCLFILWMTMVPAISYDYRLVLLVFVLPIFAILASRVPPRPVTRALVWLGVVAIAHLMATTWGLVDPGPRPPGLWSLASLCFGSKLPALLILLASMLGLLILRDRTEAPVPKTAA